MFLLKFATVSGQSREFLTKQKKKNGQKNYTSMVGCLALDRLSAHSFSVTSFSLGSRLLLLCCK
jgi:hypothetical protein